MFNFSTVWNAEIETVREDRPLAKRDHIWSSELGKSYADIYLKMRATPPTNPPDARSRRKMNAGETFEFWVGKVLERAGLLSESQLRCEYQYPGLLKVTGKLDFAFGGKPGDGDFDIDAPPAFIKAGKAIRNHIIEKYPDGVEKAVAEVKSCASTTFERYFTTQKASRNHRLQLYHYLKSTGLDYGKVIYICRDDLRTAEIPVWLNDAEVEAEYRHEIETITRYHSGDAVPPIPPHIVFDPDKGKFTVNWTLLYSDYLKMHCPEFETQSAFDNHNKPTVSRWNRVLKRMKDIQDGQTTKTGKPLTLTPNNETALKEMRLRGFNPDQLVAEYTASETDEEDQ